MTTLAHSAVTVLLGALLTSCATAPEYIDPAGGDSRAVLVKEFCRGMGRGAVNFEGIDSVEFSPYTINKLYLAPGRHEVHYVYAAPGASFDVTAQGEGSSLSYDFAPGGAYILRFLRTDPERYKVWIEPIATAQTSVADSVCLAPPFRDSKYWQ